MHPPFLPVYRCPLYPPKQTFGFTTSLSSYKRTLDVRLAPESGRNWVIEPMSAFDPKQTLTTLGGFGGASSPCTRMSHVGGALNVDVGGHEPLERPSKG